MPLHRPVAMRARQLVAVAAAVALALAAVGCTGDDDDAAADDTETSAAEFEKAGVDLAVSRSELVSPHQAKTDLDARTRDAVRDVVERLLLVTSAQPLVEGRAGGGFARLFTPDAGARAANQDREAFFDEGLPRFGQLHPVEARVGMTGLAGTMDPAIGLVVAKYVWTVESAERPGNRVARTGELSLIPAGRDWKIGAYTIAVTRTVDEATTTTTATTR